ncbi:MAG: PQQ-dependent sugar dehydrogenase [Cyclobacteriaceae bacterium]
MIRRFGMIAACGVLLWSCGGGTNDELVTTGPPEENRFAKEVFVDNLFEPTELEVLPNGNLLFSQRRGAIKLYDFETNKLSLLDSIPVHSKYEDGLMGLALDPQFSSNKWIYLYYAPPGEVPVHFLSRFDYSSKGLSNEKIVLKVDVQRDECCHTGGSVEFGSDGLLYLSTGDDTNPFASAGYAPIDARPGRSAWDARRSSANTNDLRGKILRIKPKPDGTYSIPKGNLFEDDDPRTRPEIFVMGCRNPYRISLDSKRDWLFWGDVGPDAGANNPKRGPRGHDEFNVALKAGNFGWPLFVADNQPYRVFDFETNVSGEHFVPEMPINNSPNNTGLDTLPPANPAKIFYPYANSEVFPQLKTGGRNAMAGPVYYSDQYDARGKYPSYFDGRVFYFDWMRGFIFSLELDENGNPIDWYPFMPNTEFNNLIDLSFGPDGQLYFIEYGTGWFTQNKNARLGRLKYTGGNRPPIIRSETTPLKGALPLKVTIDASGSEDYDQDRLTFIWDLDGETFQDSVFQYEFTKPGVYYPKLTLKDNKGNKSAQQFVVEVGNDPAKVAINIEGNRTFFWEGREIDYQVSVTDLEDGSLGNGIAASDVDFDIMHFQSQDKAEVLGHKKPVSNGLTLIGSLDCKSCHKTDGPSIGPSYTAIAEKYAGKPGSKDYLSNKIIVGGGGVWGEVAMSAHPDLSDEEASTIVNYILSLAKTESLPLAGMYKADKSSGNYLFSASYTDQGKESLRPISVTQNIWLQHNQVDPARYDYINGPKPTNSGKGLAQITDESWFGFKSVDLTGIGALVFNLRFTSDATMSLRADSPDGQELGKAMLAGDKTNTQVSMAVDADFQGDIYFVINSEKKGDRIGLIRSLTFEPKR